MTQPRLFGTDGIRGRAGDPPLDAATLRRIGSALAAQRPDQVLIGRDTRESGPWIEDVVSEALQAQGVATSCAGVQTTPGLSLMTRLGQFATGLMVSASHNPFHDNGLKFFGQDGEKLSDDEEASLERRIASQDGEASRLRHHGEDRLLWSDAALRRSYIDFLCADAASLDGLKIVLDCANGAAYRVAPEAFRRLGAEVILLGHQPDGRNINAQCGALHPRRMAEETRRTGATLGAAFDGDADRVILSASDGRLLDGDHIVLALAQHLKRRGALPGNTVVTTVMANMGLEAALKSLDIRMIRTAVGDRHVWRGMKEGGFVLGGEQSGHVILGDRLSCGDGILTALQIAALTVADPDLPGKTIERLVRFPQLTLNQPVASKPAFADIEPIRREIARVERLLAGQGRVLVRYSGTEPKVRIMVEATSDEHLRPSAEAIAESFKRHIPMERTV